MVRHFSNIKPGDNRLIPSHLETNEDQTPSTTTSAHWKRLAAVARLSLPEEFAGETPTEYTAGEDLRRNAAHELLTPIQCVLVSQAKESRRRFPRVSQAYPNSINKASHNSSWSTSLMAEEWKPVTRIRAPETLRVEARSLPYPGTHPIMVKTAA